ncbi:GPI-anchored surface protein, putative [Bodo saltans]|uniref:GPI-anchored surface protein, putative n=1 Tax=Bodo saltans TaxID=75058 RepID=A0A0S4INN9_BODSA|nr:GPI-anchored surface protein, putative [Bodo saltans]|eukprot:CUE90022.1 GPI-anchored surface protein, putative [Bodo saltans]
MPGKRPRSPASLSHPGDTAPLLTPILLVPFLVGAEVMTVPWALLTSRAGGGPTSLLCRSAAAVLPLLCGGATHTLTPPSSDIYDAEESTQSSSSSAEQLLLLVPTGSRSTPFAIAVDCDHHVFRCLLRLLRGYTSAVPEELRTTCCLEAHRLGLGLPSTNNCPQHRLVFVLRFSLLCTSINVS